MRYGIAGIVLAVILALSLPALAGNVEPTHYFGPGSGYPDPGSNYGSGYKYFYNYYPPDKWSAYGYGTGAMGQGYGPYVYGGKKPPVLAQDMPDFGMPFVRPKVKWIGGNEVKISAQDGPSAVQQLKVDVLAFNGAVIETGTVTASPYEIIAHLPEGAANIRIQLCLADGFNSIVVPLIPIK